ncbi:MAG TPA: class I adenylate-forming enzyme family protein [Caulobacteraceae bacterium]|nr:class I adenylate-forming enzyme family protein [Caulobacteraceae bacterium]
MSHPIRRFPDALKVRAEHQADDLAHDDTRRRLTFAEWDREADEIGGGLAAAELRPGDRVFLPINNLNAVEMAIASLAVLRAGGLVVPVNTRLAEAEVAVYFDLIEPRFCITNVPEKVAGLTFDRCWVVEDMPRDVAALPDQASLDADADAEILGTSGTTGRIKGVVVSHPDLLGRTDGVAHDPNNATLHALPFTGSGGNLGTMIAPIRGGAATITQPQFDPRGFAELAQARRPQTIYLVPSMLRLILDLPNVADYDFSGVKYLLTGTAPLPHDSVVRALELWPHLRLRNSYGMSEGGIGVSTRADEVKKPGCVGKMPAHMQIRDEAGGPAPAGTVGEIYGRQARSRRYWRDPEATAATFVGGWTRTGDLGYVDADSDLILVGRSKELIIRGGYNITPLEIETVLHAHPAVNDAAVVGVPHEVLGEDVAAAVSLREGARADVEELQAWCKARLADNKVPRTLLILPALPFNQGAKVLKRELAPLLAEAAEARRRQTPKA